MKPLFNTIRYFAPVLFLFSCQSLFASDQHAQKYIVVLKKNQSSLLALLNSTFNEETISEAAARLVTLAQQHEMLSSLQSPTQKSKALQIINQYEHVLKGFSAELTPEAVRYISQLPEVETVVPDIKIQMDAIQMDPPSWGIDRIDQQNLPLDNSYEYTYDGSGVNLYIFDTGIRSSHEEFTGRIGNGIDLIDFDSDPEDCNGHGTHVAATAAGTHYGVAKNAIIHPVRIFGCEGSGSLSTLLAGIEWTIVNAEFPAVANFSLGSPAFPLVDIAVRILVKSGITSVVSAGNQATDACTQSPARVATAITVASSTPFDKQSYFSNYGSCVDVYAPGSAIVSAGITDDTSFSIKSGTSMSSPHVTGVAALILQEHPQYLPIQVERTIKAYAAQDKISDAGEGTANLLLMVR